MVPKEIGCEGMDQIQLVQETVQWQLFFEHDAELLAP